jgi:nitrile hydratase
VNGVHDMGGMHGFGPVVRDEVVFHDDWEKVVAAMTAIVRGQGVYNIDESRHGIERMDPADYLRAGYYQRWLATLETNLVEKGVLTREEIDARAARFEANPRAEVPRRDDPALTARVLGIRPGYSLRPDGGAASFRVGDPVIARNAHPPGHTRLPRYARGKRGQIARVHGLDTLPDTNAHGLGPNPQPLYSVRFDARELWGESARHDESVYLDLWESYLAPAQAGP